MYQKLNKISIYVKLAGNIRTKYDSLWFIKLFHMHFAVALIFYTVHSQNQIILLLECVSI